MISPFLSDDAFRGQAQDIEASVANETEVGGRCDCDAGIEEGRVFHSIAIEALGAELKHLDCSGVIGRVLGFASSQLRSG